MSNYFSSGCGTCAPAFFNRNTIQAADDVDWIHGKHQFVLGGEWMRHQLNSSNIYDGNGTFAFNGTYTGDGLADLMLGALQAYNASMRQREESSLPRRDRHITALGALQYSVQHFFNQEAVDLEK